MLDTDRHGMEASAKRQELPTGRVTFLFTDTEGSTGHWRRSVQSATEGSWRRCARATRAGVTTLWRSLRPLGLPA